MIKTLIFIVSLFSLQNLAFAKKDVSYILKHEWTRLRAHVQDLKPDGVMGGYMKYKMYRKVSLLWRTSDNKDDAEVIRLYKNRKEEGHFAITYHKSSEIIDGRMVIRRFIGPEPGWINHTIDFNSGEYLGSQGSWPVLHGDEYKMMKNWNITPLRSFN